MTESGKVHPLAPEEIQALEDTHPDAPLSILSIVQYGFNELGWEGEASVLQFGDYGFAVKEPSGEPVSTIAPSGHITGRLLNESPNEFFAQLSEQSRTHTF